MRSESALLISRYSISGLRGFGSRRGALRRGRRIAAREQPLQRSGQVPRSCVAASSAGSLRRWRVVMLRHVRSSSRNRTSGRLQRASQAKHRRFLQLQHFAGIGGRGRELPAGQRQHSKASRSTPNAWTCTATSPGAARAPATPPGSRVPAESAPGADGRRNARCGVSSVSRTMRGNSGIDCSSKRCVARARAADRDRPRSTRRPAHPTGRRRRSTGTSRPPAARADSRSDADRPACAGTRTAPRRRARRAAPRRSRSRCGRTRTHRRRSRRPTTTRPPRHRRARRSGRASSVSASSRFQPTMCATWCPASWISAVGRSRLCRTILMAAAGFSAPPSQSRRPAFRIDAPSPLST